MHTQVNQCCQTKHKQNNRLNGKWASGLTCCGERPWHGSDNVYPKTNYEGEY